MASQFGCNLVILQDIILSSWLSLKAEIFGTTLPLLYIIMFKCCAYLQENVYFTIIIKESIIKFSTVSTSNEGPGFQSFLPQHEIVLTLLIRLNIAIILFLTNGPVFLYLPPHWVSFQMAALFRSGCPRSGLNDDDRKP